MRGYIAILVLCLVPAILGISLPAEILEKVAPNKVARAADYDLTCPVISCLSDGDTCTSTFTNATANCFFEGNAVLHCDYCASGLECVNNKCSSNVANANCNSNSDCSVGNIFTLYTCDDNTNKCVLRNFDNVGINGECQSNGDCFGNEQCTNGICVGVALGGTCEGNGVYDDCAWGSYCDIVTDVCTAELTQGQSCDYGAQCNDDQGLICINGTCQPYLSVSVNGFCDGSASLGCKAGLTCVTQDNDAQVCENISYDFTPGVTCTSDSCADNENCQCQDDGSARCVERVQGSYVPSSCESPLRDYVNCGIDNECKDGFYPGSCTYMNCENEYVCLAICAGEYSAAAQSIPDNCVYYSQSCNSSAKLFVSVALILAAILAFLF